MIKSCYEVAPSVLSFSDGISGSSGIKEDCERSICFSQTVRLQRFLFFGQISLRKLFKGKVKIYGICNCSHRFLRGYRSRLEGSIRKADFTVLIGLKQNKKRTARLIFGQPVFFVCPAGDSRAFPGAFPAQSKPASRVKTLFLPLKAAAFIFSCRKGG